MIILKKDNVILKESDKSRVKELKAQGYKELDEKGNIIVEQSEKTVPLADYNALKDEFETLKKENATLKSQVTKLENADKKDEDKKDKKK